MELTVLSLKEMTKLIRVIRIYTPFICTITVLLNGVLFLRGVTELSSIYLMATISGNSILLDLYILATSRRMCIWYKLTVVLLLIIQICGLLYNHFGFKYSLYIWIVILLSLAGVLSFLIFRIIHSVMKIYHKY